MIKHNHFFLLQLPPIFITQRQSKLPRPCEFVIHLAYNNKHITTIEDLSNYQIYILLRLVRCLDHSVEDCHYLLSPKQNLHQSECPNHLPPLILTNGNTATLLIIPEDVCFVLGGGDATVKLFLRYNVTHNSPTLENFVVKRCQSIHLLHSPTLETYFHSTCQITPSFNVYKYFPTF